MSSAFGQYLKLSIFGQSHGEALGVTLDGFPAGMTIDMEQLLAEMARRAPGQSLMTTARKEPDAPEFLSGVLNGRTTGQPICAIIRNTNQRSKDYGDGVDLVRPGHADYTGHVRYFGFEDWRGGGSFSGRLTAGIVLAGTLPVSGASGRKNRLPHPAIGRCAGRVVPGGRCGGRLCVPQGDAPARADGGAESTDGRNGAGGTG